MKKRTSPFSEVNFLPSELRLTPDTGVNTQLTAQQQPLHFNGLNKEAVEDLQSVRNHDKLDAFGIANKQMRESVNAYKQGEFHTAFMKSVNKK